MQKNNNNQMTKLKDGVMHPKAGTKTAIAGVAGAVVGAGVAVAATKLMSDKKMRQKVGETISTVGHQIMETMEQTSPTNGKNQKKQGSKQSGMSQKKGNQAKKMDMPQAGASS